MPIKISYVNDIGDVEESVKPLRTEDWSVIPDDRQTRIETINGVVVQDFGRVETGDYYSCKVTLSADDADKVNTYWHKRTPVKVRDVAGVIREDMRVVVKKFGYVSRFEDYYWAELEFWRI